MTRTGKIARLPHEVREELNRRLQNGETGKELLEWLNGLPKVKEVLDREFGGEPIRKQNLSAWRRGGHQDWLAQQGALAEVRRMMEESGEFGTATLGEFGDRIATWLMARCVLSAARLARSEKQDSAGEKEFRELCRNVVALRRGDHYARWIAIERERMEAEKKPDPKKMEKQFKEWAMDPEIKREFFPEQLTEDEKEEAWCQIFGVSREGYLARKAKERQAQAAAGRNNGVDSEATGPSAPAPGRVDTAMTGC